MILVQYIMFNTDFDVSKKRLVVTECLHELLPLDSLSQIQYMKSLEKKMNKKLESYPFQRHPSLMDAMIKGLAEQVLGHKM